MDTDLERVIRQALGDALAAGKDHLSQTEHAVRAGGDKVCVDNSVRGGQSMREKLP